MDFTIRLPFLTGRRESAPPVIGDERQSIVDTLHSKYYANAARGNVYTAASASAGIALLVPGTGGGHPTLWNPFGSGVNLNIIRLELSYVSGNNAPGAVEWAVTQNAAAQPATGAPILTATKVAVTNAIIGAPVNSKAIWSPTVNTFTAAPVYFRPAGISLFTGVAATAVAPFTLDKWYDGDFGVAPGTAVSLCFQTTTTTALFQVGITFEEIAL